MPHIHLHPFLAGFAGLMLAAEASALTLKAQFTDPEMKAGETLRLEVLESGDTVRGQVGQVFSLPLPKDTVWTVCAKPLPSLDSTGHGDSLGNFGEKCFEIKSNALLVGDSVIEVTLGGPAILSLDPGSGVADNKPDSTRPSAADSTLTAEAAGTQTNEEAITLKKVLVRAQRAPKRAMGKQTVSAKLIKRMPGLAEADVIRSIQGLPGVVASSDFSTKIYVRGGGSDQNLILFDNAPVYSPVHFFGLFSTFLVEGIDDVTFYKSGFPAEYGDRLSSVLDIQSRKGGKDTADAWIDASSLKLSSFATQAHTEGRKGPWRYLLAGRSTYIKEVVDFLRDQGLTDLVLDYYFYDVQGNVAYAIGPDQEASVSFYQGRDRLDFSPFIVDWGNTVIPFNLKWKLNDALTSRTTLSYSLLSQSFGLNQIFEFYNKIITWQAKQSLDYSGIQNHKLTVGIEANYMETTFRNSQFIAKTEIVDNTDFYLTSVYAQDKWSLNPWEFNPGLRVNYMSTLESVSAEPRLSVKRLLPNNQSIDVSIGWYEQFINSIIWTDQESLNEFYYPAKKTKFQKVNPTTSLLMALGWSREKWLNRLDLSLEAYYKTLNHLAVFAPNEKADSVTFSTESNLGDLFKEAEGYSYGFETSVRHNEGKLFGGFSYSHGFSVIREDNRPQSYYPKWHQPHSFKADMGINWSGKDGLWPAAKKGRYLRSSTQIKYATGLPYTDYSGYIEGYLLDQNTGKEAGGPTPEFQDNIQIQRGNYNMSFVPAYFRWDAKVVDWGREGKWNFSFTILNLTGNENVFFYTYDRSKNPPDRVVISQFPFFPFLVNYEWYF
jgi:TonB-dependent Receptor Plug Domain